MAAALIPAAATVIGAGINYMGARNANKAAQENAREQMGFQERMSNTAYQRTIQDLSSAGLNPYLAYSQGGASSPGGASSSVQNELSDSVSSAIDSQRAIAELDNLKAQNANLNAQNQQIHAGTTKTEVESMILKNAIPKSQYNALVDSSKRDVVKFAKDRVLPGISSAHSMYNLSKKKGFDWSM